MSTIYIHYGSDKFDRTRFGPIKNRAIPWVKPEGRSGLWACRVDAENSWKEFCEQDALWPDRIKESFKFKLSKKAKVAYLNKPSDCDKLPLYKNNIDSTFFDRTERFINFEECLKQGIDAIEVVDIWGRENPDHYDYMETLYYALYGWDCDSILILNPDIVEEI